MLQHSRKQDKAKCLEKAMAFTIRLWKDCQFAKASEQIESSMWQQMETLHGATGNTGSLLFCSTSQELNQVHAGEGWSEETQGHVVDLSCAKHILLPKNPDHSIFKEGKGKAPH